MQVDIPEELPQKPDWKKKLVSLLKYPVAVLILVYVLRQTELDKIEAYVRTLPPFWFILALLAFSIAQVFSTLRMNLYYREAGRHIDFWYAMKLCYVGLFYNIILPGGIGGDAYKIFLLKRAANFPVREGIRIQLQTRANGLLVLLLMLYASVLFMPVPWSGLRVLGGVLLCCIVTLTAYMLLSKWLLKESSAMGLRALPYSVGVQSFNVLSMVILWKALGAHGELADYVFLFQLAAVAGMIPVTIGGLGIREFTFFKGGELIEWLTGTMVDGELGVTISLLVFVITVASALFGLPWIGRIAKMKPCHASVS